MATRTVTAAERADDRATLLVGGPTQRSVWRQRLRHEATVRGVIGALIVVGIMLTALLAPWIAPYDPASINHTKVLSGPSTDHWLGNDNLGRDVLSRLIYGARVSVQAGIIATGLSLVLGVAVGLVAGFASGWIDNVLMRFVDAFLAFPPLVFLIAVTAMLGPSLTNAMIAIGISGFPSFARLVRGEVLTVRELDYIEASRSIGSPPTRIMLRHMLPNITGPIIVWSSLHVGIAILAEAGLSFLGLGVQPPAASWGSMINLGNSYLERAPWIAISAGAAIFVAVLGTNLFGDMLRDLLDPRLRGAQASAGPKGGL